MLVPQKEKRPGGLRKIVGIQYTNRIPVYFNHQDEWNHFTKPECFISIQNPKCLRTRRLLYQSSPGKAYLTYQAPPDPERGTPLLLDVEVLPELLQVCTVWKSSKGEKYQQSMILIWINLDHMEAICYITNKG